MAREIILLGLRRAGKTSISRVVFGNMDPSQTQYLHATYAVTPTQVSADALAKFTILDFPGQEDLVAKDIIGMRGQMKECGALVFVLDCTDYSPSTGGGKRADYEEAINRLVLVVEQMHIVTEPEEVRTVDVFLHKADKLTSEHQRSVQEEVRQQLQFRLKGRLTADVESRKVIVRYHLTSIFDHSVFYAFSLVARRVIPNILHIQSLLQVCCNNSRVLSYFLFGISRRMFIASANVNDDQRASEREVFEYECCSDLVDLFQSMHTFVGTNQELATYRNTLQLQQQQQQQQFSLEDIHNNNNNNSEHKGGSTLSPATTNSPSANTAFPSISASSTAAAAAGNNNNNAQNNKIDNNKNGGQDGKQEQGNNNNHSNNGALTLASNSSAQQQNQQQQQPGDLVDTTQSAVFTFPAARPNDSIKPVYFVRQVGPLLTLVVGLKNENVDAMKSAIEYNIDNLERALMKILKINEEVLQRSQ